MWIRVELVIFVIKLTLLQNYIHFTTPDRHFMKTHITFYQNTHKYYNFWYLRWDGPTAGPKNFPLHLWYLVGKRMVKYCNNLKFWLKYTLPFYNRSISWKNSDHLIFFTKNDFVSNIFLILIGIYFVIFTHEFCSWTFL